ncbi:uncharacterized protein LOC129592739 [Paramacrobiotus metropolitanus]|uniref:uncharacterized protein LOC129592739 n=1 Tax=Paramacrobiotus metropolitanus TaxID=2943436 RepID=UPI0024461C4D|nr:uncharacterized protein LOC129592739 [Paramacrobiotus metropolitanus]
MDCRIIFISLLIGWIQHPYYVRASKLPSDWRNLIDPSVAAPFNASSAGDIISEPDSPGAFGIYAAQTGQMQAYNYWPTPNAIPYVIYSGFDFTSRRLIETAMRTIERRTFSCVAFKERTDEEEYISLYPGRCCEADIGRVPGYPTRIRLAPFCMTPGVIQHELLHALGLFHEQNRPDRDDHIAIYTDHIQPGRYDPNFVKLPHLPTHGTQYDLLSLMHYGPFDFAVSQGTPVILPKTGTRKPIKMGQREGLSILDVAKLQIAYNCALQDLPSDSSTATCSSVIPEPFPKFSTQRMTAAQCRAQFSANCRNAETTKDSCMSQKALSISCTPNATATEVRTIATGLANGLLRAVAVVVHDGRQTVASNFQPIRKQVVVLEILHCRRSRTTGQLSDLNFPFLLEFALTSCSQLDIQRGDFRVNRWLRMITLENSTIRTMEEDTFSDLPALRLLALEFSVDMMTEFRAETQEYIRRLHCDCRWAWFRRWWRNNLALLRNASDSEIYRIPGSFGNVEIPKEAIYVPINCAAQPFPSSPKQINFTRVEYSINDKCD